MSSLLEDLGSSLRSLARRPGFAVTAALILGLGAGANAAFFSFVNASVLRPLPFPEPERLVTIWEADPRDESRRLPLSPDHFLLLLEQQSSLGVVGAYVAGPNIGFDLAGGESAERVAGAAVTPELFEALGVQPALGRWFTPEEGDAGGEPIAILSDDLWRRRFGADPAIVGQAASIGGIPRTIVGVMPPGFDFPGVELWIPDPFDVSEAMGLPLTATYNLRVIVRLRSGASVEQARAVLAAFSHALAAENGDSAGAAPTFSVVSLRQALLGNLPVLLRIFAGVVFAVLLIACTNLSNLILGRLITRGPELALRTVLGATPGRLLRMVLLEGAVIGLLGGVAGLVFGRIALAALLPLCTPYLAQLGEVRIDGRVLAFLLIVSCLCGVLAGLVPALRSCRIDLSQILKEETTASSRRSKRLWSSLVVVQLALTTVLLAGAGLMLQSFQALIERDMGFRPQGVLTLEMVLSHHRHPTVEAQVGFVAQVVEEMERTPGIIAAAAANALPFRGGGLRTPVLADTAADPGSGRLPEAACLAVTSSFFRVLGIPLRQGRGFDAARHGGHPVAVVDERLARSLWPGKNPLGRQIQVQGTWREIIGVTRQVEFRGPWQETEWLVFVPLDQFPLPWPFLQIAVQTEGDPLSKVPRLTAAVQRIDAGQPVQGVAMLDELADRGLARERLASVLLGAFSLLGLSLAATGVYALVAFSMARRRREIGIRLAVGAAGRDVLWLVIRESLGPSILGVAAGVVAGLFSARVLSRFLYGIPSSDPAVFLAVCLFVVAISLGATLGSARRALRVNPVRELRGT